MNKKNCLFCEKEFEIREDKNGRLINKQIYCSKRCKDKAHYLRHKEYYIENAKRWIKENPSKYKINHKKAMDKYIKTDGFRNSVMKNYYNNKDKWNSRNVINKIILGRSYKKFDVLKKQCKKCGTKDNLEIHHEIYPTKVKEIKEAILNGRIYYLCLKCHGRRNNHIKMNTHTLIKEKTKLNLGEVINGLPK